MLTPDQLADATGLTPVHVDRMLQALRGEGLLSRKRSSEVLNWQCLCDAADFTPGYLHFPEREEAGKLEAVHCGSPAAMPSISPRES